MPATFADLLHQLTTNPIFLGLAASLVTGWIVWAAQTARPGWVITGNAARGLAVAVAFGLALLAYGGEVVQGTTVLTAEGVYQLVLLTLVVVGSSQSWYTGYKVVAPRAPAPPPAEPTHDS